MNWRRPFEIIWLINHTHQIIHWTSCTSCTSTRLCDAIFLHWLDKSHQLINLKQIRPAVIMCSALNLAMEELPRPPEQSIFVLYRYGLQDHVFALPCLPNQLQLLFRV